MNKPHVGLWSQSGVDAQKQLVSKLRSVIPRRISANENKFVRWAGFSVHEVASNSFGNRKTKCEETLHYRPENRRGFYNMWINWGQLTSEVINNNKQTALEKDMLHISQNSVFLSIPETNERGRRTKTEKQLHNAKFSIQMCRSASCIHVSKRRFV